MKSSRPWPPKMLKLWDPTACTPSPSTETDSRQLTSGGLAGAYKASPPLKKKKSHRDSLAATKKPTQKSEG